jgi:hypothetical protein
LDGVREFDRGLVMVEEMGDRVQVMSKLENMSQVVVVVVVVVW